MWQFAETMAGYEQQDAHEFLMSVLDGLHLALAPSDNLSHPCPCLVHSVFSSSLRSTLTCCACDGISVAVDPIMDISLDLKGSTVLSEEKDIFSVPNETMGLLSVGLSADEGTLCSYCRESNFGVLHCITVSLRFDHTCREFLKLLFAWSGFYRH
jgi:ubiquitin C-terminal hydrolase